jgi:DNA-binding NarL/FixJ family response regulator
VIHATEGNHFMETNRLSIVESNAVIRSGIQVLLVQQGVPQACISVYETPDDFIEALPANKVDAVFLDDGQRAIADITFIIESIHKIQQELVVIILSDRLAVSYIQHVMSSGANGYIYKAGDMEQALAMAVSCIRRGTKVLPPDVSEALLMGNQVILIGNLNTRDIDVLELTEAGKTVKQIAYGLGIEQRTVYRSRERLRDALNVQTNDLIVDAARRLGLLKAK